MSEWPHNVMIYHTKANIVSIVHPLTIDCLVNDTHLSAVIIALGVALITLINVDCLLSC